MPAQFFASKSVETRLFQAHLTIPAYEHSRFVDLPAQNPLLETGISRVAFSPSYKSTSLPELVCNQNGYSSADRFCTQQYLVKFSAMVAESVCLQNACLYKPLEEADPYATFAEKEAKRVSLTSRYSPTVKSTSSSKMRLTGNLAGSSSSLPKI